LSLHTSTGIRFWRSAQVMLLACSQGEREYTGVIADPRIGNQQVMG